MHAKNVQSFDTGTMLVIAGWAILPVLCMSHYRLGYPAKPRTPTTSVTQNNQSLHLSFANLLWIWVTLQGSFPPDVGSVMHISLPCSTSASARDCHGKTGG